jgi:hypothetical protein
VPIRIFLVLLAVAAACAGAACPSPVRAAEKPSIAWRPWSAEAFDEARRTKRLVLLDLTSSWGHWCRVMAESSYIDSAVVALVSANFIPIRVDYELRPDIGDRYLANAWPTTSILSADGHVLMAKTYLPARELRQYLADALRFYRANRSVVARKVAEAERAVARTWEPDSLLPATTRDEELIEQNLVALRDLEDREHGGFGTAPKAARWDAISFLLRAADARGDDAWRALAVRAAAAALTLQDSLDGGFFRTALKPDWTARRYERLLDEQAKAISTLTRVHRATGEARFQAAADRAVGFVERWLLRSSGVGGGLWSHSVGPDARLEAGRRGATGPWVDGEVYFRLSRVARAKLARPAAPAATTTHASARMVSALFPRDPRLALARLDRLVREMARGDGSYYHAAADGARHGPGLLADQAAMGHAFLDAAEAAPADGSWMARADSLAAWLRARLEDPVEGAFRYAPRDTSAVGRLRAGDKPEAANVEAALFFVRRYERNGRQEDRDVAERVARYLRSEGKLTLDPALAELVLRLSRKPTPRG